jgi:hypothetical protein
MKDDLKWGGFRRLRPISDFWGIDRGRPIDRFYIESFLSNCASDITGRVLEVENPGYTILFGGSEVSHIDVLDVDESNPKATVIADLAMGEGLPDSTSDCLILTQTLQLIFDLKGAVNTIASLLKPGGVVLATVPGITPVPIRDEASKIWCWSFTTLSIQQLFSDVFGEENIQVRSYGNVLSATSFLWGLSQGDLTIEELQYQDPDYQVIIAIRATKP